jgi:hypothetical protein
MRSCSTRFSRTWLSVVFATAASAVLLGCPGTDSAPEIGDPTLDASADAQQPLPGDDAGPKPPTDDAGVDAAIKRECESNDVCASKVCNLATGTCSPANCKDGVKNQDEADTDCGGLVCDKCDVQKTCGAPADCASGVCTAGVCQAPTCTDALKNGTESDTDCGGATCGKCADGKKCAVRGDCGSDVCTGGICQTPACNDGAKNGTDTDVDCGGPTCPRCAATKTCLVADDCASGVCADKGMGLRCQPPSCTDGIKNGTETDKDCGGAACPACGSGKACMQPTDCASAGCNYDKKCAVGRSCTRHYGGDTCGAGGAGGDGNENWEDCCARANVTVAGNVVSVDKYQVTAGRMRAFLEDVNYDVRGFVQGARAAGKVPVIPGGAKTVLEADWDMYLPTSFAGNADNAELLGCAQKDCLPLGNPACTCNPGTSFRGIYSAVSRHLGGFIFNGNAQTSTGCYVGSPGTHAFRFPDGVQDGTAPAPSHGQDLYDTKSMNCVDYLVGQAFCVWDGGRLESIPEWQAIYGAGATPYSAVDARLPVLPEERGLAVNRGDQTYWGCRFPWATDAQHPACGLTWDINTRSIELSNYRYSYEYPKIIASDYIVFLAAPGRTRGRGPQGHADVIGNNFELTSTVTYAASPLAARHRWSGNGSWEVHGYNKNGGGSTMLLNKYGKLGLRCVH